MPPHQMLSQVPSSIVEVNAVQSREKDQINMFSEYCRIFYTHSVSFDNKIERSSDGYLESGRSHIEIDDERLKTCKLVLEAFNSICVSNRPIVYENQAHNDAVAKCGLLEPCFAEGENGMIRVGAYMKARDEERKKVHEEQMRERKQYFLSLLQEKEEDYYSNLISEEADFCTKMKRCDKEGKLKDVTRKFVRSYKNRTGVHSFLAGLRQLLETQYENRLCVVRWSFDFATLTENCSGGDDSLLHDALSLIVCLLSKKKLGNSSEEDISEETDSSVMKWALQDYVSLGLIKRILNVLPRQKDLDARPTGNIFITSEKRKNVKDKKAAALDNWCIVL